MALPDKPNIDVLAVSPEAIDHHPTVAILIDFKARRRTRCGEELVQRKGRFLPAAIFFPGSITANLPAFGRVDAVEANSLAGDFNCVAVDHRSPSG